MTPTSPDFLVLRNGKASVDNLKGWILYFFYHYFLKHFYVFIWQHWVLVAACGI